jgi:hypothetical protein
METHMTQFQTQWRFCTKCSNMNFNNGVPGVCLAGGDHRQQGFDFGLPFGVPEGAVHERHFFFCKKCHCLFQEKDFGSGDDLGRCGGGGQHDRTDSTEFVLPHDTAVTVGQDKWVVCVNCHVLFFGPAANQKCIANSLGHNPGQGNFPDFNVPHTADPANFIP